MCSIPSRLATAVLSVSLAGCVVTPHDGWSYSSRSSTISFLGYASESEAEVVIECQHATTGAWVEIGGDTANTNPGNPIHDHPLFEFYDQVVVPNGCWTNHVEFGYSTRVRVREPEASYVDQLYTFDDDAMLCVNEKLSNGQEWVPAGAQCASGTTMTLWALS